MATVTKSTLAARVMQHLGVLAAGQSAASRDSDLVQESIDTVHDQLGVEGKAPFVTSAIPEWAQGPLRDIVAYEMAGTFGVTSPQRLQILAANERRARQQLAKQLNNGPMPIRTEVDYF